jgi:uncharacterized protein (TIGR02284 family)
MALNMKEVRSTLNDLIETCKDGEEGFRASARNLKDAELRRFFLASALQRTQFAGALQAEVILTGADPVRSGSTAGAIHRGWLGLKSALAGENDLSILEEAERSEEAAVENYREALDKDLPAELRGIIEEQYREIQQAHNRVRLLRETAERKTMPMSGLV